VDLATMMDLEPYGDRDDDAWVATGPRYPWGGLYGGQIVAQGLMAAAMTVDEEFLVHSLHASFIRSGSHTEKILFEVDRVRDGRSFCNRRIVARQAVGAILTMTASFQIEEDDVSVQTAVRPTVLRPDELRSDRWTPLFDRCLAPAQIPGTVAGWLRVDEDLGDDPMLQAAALAYLSDDLPTDAVVSLHPDRVAGDQFHETFFSASLDHAVWFHQPVRADEWHVQAFTCHGLMGSRGVSIGQVFGADGVHAATISQEVVLRRRHGA
jgi:acyl-CoA thioesterase II